MAEPSDGTQPFADGSGDAVGFGELLPDDAWLRRVRAAVQPLGLGRLGPYELLDQVACGAQGIVYCARDTRVDRVVALKRLTAGRFATARQQRRFERELEATAALRHPHVVSIDRYEIIGGQPLLSMEWIDGVTLDRWTRPEGTRKGLDDILGVFRMICDAVEYAHQHGVIHRDLKPGNILVVEEAVGGYGGAATEKREASSVSVLGIPRSSGACPKVLDFGLAVLADDGPLTERFTATSEFVGTPAYAAPEQVRGDRAAIGICTDIYALGVLLYEMLAGRLPFSESGGLAGLFDAIRAEDAPPPSRWSPDVSADLDAIVLKALAKEPSQRYQSVGAFSADLGHVAAGEPVEARHTHRGYAIRLLLRRHRFALIAAAAGVALLAAWAATLSVMYARQGRLLAEVTAARDESQGLQRTFGHLMTNVAELGRGADLALRREVLDGAAKTAEADLSGRLAAWAEAEDAIGRTYQQLGLYEEAERRLRAALASRIALYGHEHREVATSLTHLACLLSDRSRGVEADPLFREALAMRRRLLGDEHPEVAESMHHVAIVLQSREEYEAAVAMHRQTLDLQQRLLGPDHPDIALSLTGLGYAYFNLRDYTEAEKCFRAALEMRLRLVAEPNRDVAGCRVDLGKALYEQGRLEEAEPILRSALATFRQLLGPVHDNTAWAAHRLGLVLTARGSFDEAEALLREALATYRQTLGEETAYTGFVLESLAELLAETNRNAEALSALRDAERIFAAQAHQSIPIERVRTRLAQLASQSAKPGDSAGSSEKPDSDPSLAPG
ncbi:MAG: serine/threonine protein kinase [Phycisphaerae bacterium]|nr:serine/threonine protein kinase [Phycisphaerae bacterium]